MVFHRGGVVFFFGCYTFLCHWIQAPDKVQTSRSHPGLLSCRLLCTYIFFSNLGCSGRHRDEPARVLSKQESLQTHRLLASVNLIWPVYCEVVKGESISTWSEVVEKDLSILVSLWGMSHREWVGCGRHA